MATIVRSGNFITITLIAADVTPSDIFTCDQLKTIKSFEFKAGADGDVCAIKYGADDGAVITILACEDEFNVDRKTFDEGGQFCSVYIDFSAGVFSAGHSLTIELA